MSTLTELAQHISQLYPLTDKSAGRRYRIVNQLAGLTELEDTSGRPRYIASWQLRDRSRWEMAS
ncbi:MAG TPA: hypothetical protein VL178_03340 [Pseudomonas sp.]|nr:hypothetical protein [Pseudomonas sp.]